MQPSTKSWSGHWSGHGQTNSTGYAGPVAMLKIDMSVLNGNVIMIVIFVRV